MKKTTILGIIGLVSGLASSSAQSVILLDNYNSNNGAGGPIVTYSWLFSVLDGSSGSSSGLNNSFTAGLYYAVGDIGLYEPASSGIPSASLTLATGIGSTAQFDGLFPPGYFSASTGLLVAPTPGALITAEVVFYTGPDYASSSLRAHTASFTMPTSLNTSPDPNKVGDYMTVPEPSAVSMVAIAGFLSFAFQRRWLNPATT